MEQKIINSLKKLEYYIESEKYRGYDPYDGLTSPIFNLYWLKKNRVFRFYFQQMMKRLPINIRPFLLIKKEYNPVSLALCLHAYIYLSVIFESKSELYLQKVRFLIDELETMIIPGYSGACWGYNFDWESRYVTIPASTPTLVTTAIVSNALFNFYELEGDAKAFGLVKSSANFIMNDLNKTNHGNHLCYSYTPIDRQIVFNATMKAARLLAQVYSVTKNKDIFLEAQKTVSFIANSQQENGSWIYSKGDHRKWVDNYHTGYLLDCLDDYIKLTDDRQFEANLTKGFAYYLDNFFYKEKIPKFLDNKIHPIDCTSAAQSILTLTRFRHTDIALNIAIWMGKMMQSGSGSFYYRKYKLFTNKISFMRWSNSWMLLSLSYLLYNLRKEN